eukprot:13794756-Alexandrium_andersonii.AAC.1
MSASLVGSEMCIRDSSSPCYCGCCKAPPRGGAPRRRFRRSPGPGGNVPVSYTHLTLPTICSV